MLKNYVYNDCTHKCRSDIHGSEITSAITLRSLTDNQLASYIYCICANYGHVLDKYGRSALHMAAACGKKYLCKWLITLAKADINLKDKESGYTPIHHSIFYGQLHVTVLLAKYGANMGAMDFEEMRPLDHLIRDRKVDITVNQLNEVYCWGTNANYNLGTGSQQTRETPELLEFLKRVSIKQVCMDKFHSVFVSDDGKVWSCGHGQGGRLGLGSESSVLAPTKLNFEKDKDRQGVLMASISQDHSVFLMNSGAVFVCGLNCYHQLGLSPPPSHIVTPSPIPRHLLKSSHPLIGVSCGRFHTVVYSSREIFSFGVHAGQLGHSNVTLTSASVIEPKVISMLPLKDGDVITEVVTCDTATVVRVNTSDIYLCYQYECRKFQPFHLRKRLPFDQSGKTQTIEQMGVAGGRFKTPLPQCLPPYEGEDLKLAVLSNYGNIYLWTESNAQFTRCVFISLRYTLVQQFAFQANHLAFVSTDGQSFLCSDLNLKQKTSTTISTSATQKKSKGEYLTVQDLFSDVAPTYMIRAERLCNVHRAVKITSDPKGYNFAVLQFRPLDFLLATNDMPRITSSQFTSQLTSLLFDANECDVLHDVIFQVGDSRFPAHKYILASRCKGLYDLCSETDNGSPVLIDNVQPELFKQILLYVYTNDCDLLQSGQFKLNVKATKQENLLKVAVECATRFQLDCLVERLKAFKSENRTLVLRDPEDIPPSPAVPCFSRQRCQELCDVAISSCDGAVIKAHKCVLAGRLEYFQHMLSGGWAEADTTTPLQLPIPGSVLHEVINFLYSNTTSKPVTYDCVEYWANLLVVADQLFIESLKQSAEVGLTYSISLKNAVDLFGFAVTYNATQLKTAVMMFISLNMSAFIESRALESLSDSLMKDLMDFYKTKMNIAHRVVTPCTCDTSALEERVLDIARNHPNPWRDQNSSASPADLKQSKSKASRPGTRRRRKSTLSEDETPSSNSNPLTHNISSFSHSNNSLSQQSLSKSESDSANVSSEGGMMRREECSEKWSTIQKHQKSIDAQVRVMNAVKESPDLLQLEYSFTRLQTIPSAPIAVPAGPDSILSPPPSLEDSSQFPLLGLLSTSPDAKGPRLSDQPRKSSKSSRSSFSSRKLNLGDLVGHLTPAEPIVSALPSTSVWGSSATSPPVKSPWTAVEHNAHSTISLKEIVRETKLSTASNGGLSRSDPSFSDIVADEIKKKDNFVRMTSKCLDFIQLEDRAIQELKLFYNADNSFEEHLTISRVVTNHMNQPMWISGKQIQTNR